MNLNINNKNLIIFLPALLIIVVLLIVKEKGREGGENPERRVTPLPEISADSRERTKSEIYAEEAARKRKERETGKSQKKNIDDLFKEFEEKKKPDQPASFDTYSEQIEQDRNATAVEDKKPVPVAAPTKKVPAYSTKAVPEKKEDPITPLSEEKKETPYESSGMGVFVASPVQEKNPTGENGVGSKKISTGYFNAVLEQDCTVEHNGNVIFILSKDATIEGISHKKGSVLYGRAMQKNEGFDIIVYQIKSTDGNMYSSNLVVFDENYNRGIRSQGALNQAARRNTEEAVTGTMDVRTNRNLVDAAVTAVSRTAAQSRNRDISVSLMKGYKVYLQENEVQKR